MALKLKLNSVCCLSFMQFRCRVFELRACFFNRGVILFRHVLFVIRRRERERKNFLLSALFRVFGGDVSPRTERRRVIGVASFRANNRCKILSP